MIGSLRKSLIYHHEGPQTVIYELHIALVSSDVYVTRKAGDVGTPEEKSKHKLFYEHA